MTGTQGVTDKQQRILDAAETQFRMYGLSGARMEAIAKAARVAKPTLYGYFANKEAVYRAVSERIYVNLRTATGAALDGPGAPAERIAAALTAKKKAVFKILEGSPHADELVAAQGTHAGAEMEAFERWLEGRIARVLNDAGHEEAGKYAQLLMACAEGIMRRAQFAGQIGPAIRLTTEKLLA